MIIVFVVWKYWNSIKSLFLPTKRRSIHSPLYTCLYLLSQGLWSHPANCETIFVTGVLLLTQYITVLELAWFLGFKQLILESDVTVEFITKDFIKLNVNYTLISKARKLLASDWEVKVQARLQGG
jgi:hypothetical protein